MAEHAHAHGDGEHHILPYSVYFGVYFALLILTYLTVQVSLWNLGPLSMPVAMLVAVIKAAFVVGFFMHLRYDNKFLSLIFFGSLVFIVVFFAFTMFDLTTRGALVREEGTFALRTDVKRLNQEGKPTKKSEAKGVYAVAAKAAKEIPTADGSFVVKKDYSFPADAPKATPEVLAMGKKVYTKNCVSCHGAQGLGDGATAKALNPKPSNIAGGKYRYGGTPRDIYRIITNGSPNYMMMVAWKATLKKEERWAVVRYLTTLDKTWPKVKTKAAKPAAPAPAKREAAPAKAAPEQRKEAPVPTQKPAAPAKPTVPAPAKREAAPAKPVQPKAAPAKPAEPTKPVPVKPAAPTSAPAHR